MSEFILSAKQIARNWQTFRTLINERFPTRKDALNRLYDSMEEDERIQMAPASSYEFFHNAIPGGYVEHVLRVYEFALEQFSLWQKMGMKVDNFTLEELEFSALHHDLGKLGLPGLNGEYYQPQESKWHRENQGKLYQANSNLPYMKTHDVTLYLLNHFQVPYSLNEMLAIKLTDGLFEETNKFYFMGFEKNAKLRTSLPYLMHHADLMAYRFEFERWATASEKFKLELNVNSQPKPVQVPPQTTEKKPFGMDVFDEMFGTK